jgi:hypothetical protein
MWTVNWINYIFVCIKNWIDDIFFHTILLKKKKQKEISRKSSELLVMINTGKTELCRKDYSLSKLDTH